MVGVWAWNCCACWALAQAHAPQLPLGDANDERDFAERMDGDAFEGAVQPQHWNNTTVGIEMSVDSAFTTEEVASDTLPL